jgi:dephospho-CoA kinase
MKVIGIVGGMGAGKTTVVSLMKALKKIFVISADQIGHDILLKNNKAYHEVVNMFGESILGEDGDIVRERLGNIVFKDPQKLLMLNQITHPLIFEEVKTQISLCRQEEYFELVIIDAALLIEIGLTKLTDKIIAVYATDEIRLNRIIERQGLSKEQVLQRFKAQKKWEEFKSIAHEIIDTSVSVEYTKEQINDLIVRL